MNRFIANKVQAAYNRIRNKHGKIYASRTQFVLANIKADKNLLILGARENFISRVVDYTENKLTYKWVKSALDSCLIK